MIVSEISFLFEIFPFVLIYFDGILGNSKDVGSPSFENKTNSRVLSKLFCSVLVFIISSSFDYFNKINTFRKLYILRYF